MKTNAKNKPIGHEKSKGSFSRTGLGKAVTVLEQRLEQYTHEHPLDPYPVTMDKLIAHPQADGVLFAWNLTSGSIARARTLLTAQKPAELQLRIYLDKGFGSADVVPFSVSRWTDTLRYPVPKTIKRASATIGLLCGDDFIHIVGSAPVRLMTNSSGSGEIKVSTVERGTRLIVGETKDWEATMPPIGWQLNGLAHSTVAVVPRAGELDKARVERRPSKGET